jgi:N-methylhydantoinase A
MQSNGGALTPPAARARPVTLALSGPAAGVMACVQIGLETERGSLIGLDMGGTSADISIVAEHEPRYTAQLTLGDLPIRLPSIEVRSIGAGGGSIAAVDSGGALHVGPESAGSLPGPACYGRGGTNPTITDAQLVLGRLDSEQALGGRLRLDLEAARRALARVAEPLDVAIEEAAAGIVEVANAAMERALRVALRARGDDPREFALVAFGGAGPLHAAELAQRLSIGTVVIPPYPGTLSALGLLTADVRMDFATSEICRSDHPDTPTVLRRSIVDLEDQASAQLRTDAHLREHTWRFDRACDVRYVGQAYEVTVPIPHGDLNEVTVKRLLTDFHYQHERAYGFASPNEPCELVTYRVAASVLIDKPAAVRNGASPRPEGRRRDVYMPSRSVVSAAIHRREDIPPATRIEGPAVIHHADATTLIPEFAVGEVDAYGNLILTLTGL